MTQRSVQKEIDLTVGNYHQYESKQTEYIKQVKLEISDLEEYKCSVKERVHDFRAEIKALRQQTKR